jgi:hypothetical protein
VERAVTVAVGKPAVSGCKAVHSGATREALASLHVQRSTVELPRGG